MKKLLTRILFGKPRRGEKVYPPAIRTTYPDGYISWYVWQIMTHASTQWAHDFHLKNSAK